MAAAKSTYKPNIVYEYIFYDPLAFSSDICREIPFFFKYFY